MSIADVVDIAGEIPENHHPQIDFLDRPPFVAQLYDIADAELILQEDEEPADHIADKILGSEAHGKAQDTGGGKDGTDIDPQFPEDHHPRDDHDDHTHRVAHHRAERLGALLGLDRACSRADLPEDPPCNAPRDPDDSKGQKDNDRSLQPCEEEPLAGVRDHFHDVHNKDLRLQNSVNALNTICGGFPAALIRAGARSPCARASR